MPGQLVRGAVAVATGAALLGLAAPAAAGAVTARPVLAGAGTESPVTESPVTAAPVAEPPVTAVPGTAVAVSVTAPATGSPPVAAAGAAGDFVAAVDLASAQARDVGGGGCELTVRGTLTFSGTVRGSADGTTTALIFAPCVDALAAPPGTFADVFGFRGAFAGEVLGVPVSGPLRYAGVTRAGGDIEAAITLSGGGVRAVLRADARVADGGTYRGIARSL